MGIEPASLTAVFCHNAADRSAASWHEQLAPFAALEFAISDAAGGIASGLDRVVQPRRSAGVTTPLARGLDLFHTAREARPVLKKAWREAEAVWVKAEAADARVASSKRQGLDARGVAKAALAAWRRAVATLEGVERQESAWRRARAALDLFDAEGRLNDRDRARTEASDRLDRLPLQAAEQAPEEGGGMVTLLLATERGQVTLEEMDEVGPALADVLGGVGEEGDGLGVFQQRHGGDSLQGDSMSPIISRGKSWENENP